MIAKKHMVSELHHCFPFKEPILQWKLGTSMTKNDISKLYPHVVDLKATKCPCANDVALLGFIVNTTLAVGVYVGLSFSGFWNYDSIMWYNLTDMIYSQVAEEHTEISLVDMVLTNHFLVILTSLGLFISEDLRYPSSSVLTVDYIKGKLWYNERCFANREHFEGTKTIPSTLVTFLVDQEQSSGVFLCHNQAPDMGFETALAPQYITVNEMIFFAYVPKNEPKENIHNKKFNGIHAGKVIHSR
ncbi:hypothetical protein CB1_000726121 [Camelus ferus]|nr:hypothetical protein CB1_000726121 [Camelus ferus]